MDYSSSAFFQSLFQQLTNAATIVTPNRRLAAHLRKIYTEFQQNKGLDVWHSPDILPLSSWFIRSWQNLGQQSFAKVPYLLSHNQEKYLWEKILSESSHHHLLLQVAETAELIQSAHSLLTDWQVSLDQQHLGSTDYVALNQWLEAFERICQQRNWMTQANLPSELLRLIKQNLDPAIKSRDDVDGDPAIKSRDDVDGDPAIKSRDDVVKDPASTRSFLPKTIILYGFNELAPQIKTFFDECIQLGCQVLMEQPILENQRVQRITCQTTDDEIYLAARYAKEKSHIHPAAQIGVVFLNLEQQRDRIKQIFNEVFPDETTFNISAGRSLNLYPIIHAALQILSLYHGNLTLSIMGFLLSTPFLGHAEQERFQRARFDEILRAKNISSLNFSTSSNREYWERYVPKLTHKLTSFYTAIAKLPVKQSFTQWGKDFHDLLTAIGWPGERSLSSEEYQTVDNWLALFAEFNNLDYVDDAVTYSQALLALNKITKSRKFQPQSPAANVQILGLLEAAAIPFDHLWITGMTDVAWPPAPNPHPFIPKNLQRQLNMPHATAQREFNYCREITHQFQQCATEVICSHHQHYDDIECSPSSLIISFTEISPELLSLPSYKANIDLLFENRFLEKIIDNRGPALAENEVIHGGASVLKHQAMCAFKAFAEWRLHAHELEDPLQGLRAKDRGALVHRALQLVWTQVGNHESLTTLNETQLTKIIADSVEQTFDEKLAHYLLRPQYVALEKQRLIKLINNWLVLEKQRAPFRVIQHEQKAEIKINQLKLSMRIDRIDELESGKHLIIDYKTGKSNEIRHWFSDRPDEPQLPLYALIAPENLIGISYAQVAPGNFSFKGISKDEISVAGIKHLEAVKYTEKNNWQEQLEEWQSILTTLANNFSLGEAAVEPKDGQTCIYCQLKPLCRIYEDETYGE